MKHRGCLETFDDVSGAKRKWPQVLLFISLSVFIIIALFKWIALDWIVDLQVAEQVRLSPGSDTWNKWIEIPIPIYLSFRFFNVTNPQEVQIGRKPKLQEVGPYVYEEKRTKNVLSIDKEQETITYNQPIYYYFRQDLSAGRESDRIILANIPFLTVAKTTSELTNITLAYGFVDRILRQRGERLFMYNTVKEYLFEGFDVSPYVAFLSNPILQFVGNVAIPDAFSGNKFGFYKGRNGSDDGEFVVRSGISNPREFGRIVSWNGKTKLDYWEGNCNLINGTDGSILSPFIQKTDILRFFVPDICRSLLMIFNEEIEYKGIKGYRFELPHPKTVFSRPDFCFCPKKKNIPCYKQGVFTLKPCRDVAAPHFFQSYEPYLQAVEGLNPDKEHHDTYLDIEPKTGLILRAKKRLQFNIQMEPNSHMPTFANVPTVLLPFLWIEETGELTEKLLEEVKSQLVDTVEMANSVTTGGLISSSVLVILGILACLALRFSRRKKVNSLHSDDENEDNMSSHISDHSLGSAQSLNSTISRSTMTSENKATMTDSNPTEKRSKSPEKPVNDPTKSITTIKTGSLDLKKIKENGVDNEGYIKTNLKQQYPFESKSIIYIGSSEKNDNEKY